MCTRTLSDDDSSSEPDIRLRSYFSQNRSALQILLSMNHDEKSVDEMLRIGRRKYEENNKQLDCLNALKEYNPADAIKNYTATTFLFRIVNETLRTEDIKEIFPFRVYISDLHKALGNGTGRKPSFIVYRGKKLSASVLQHLIDDQDGLITMNGFLSTSLKNNFALAYAGNNQDGYGDDRSVIFEFQINSMMKQLFADVSCESKIPDDEEFLFSIGVIWHIVSTRCEDIGWRIILQSCDKLDVRVNKIHQQCTRRGCNLLSLGDILQDLGDNFGAESLYEQMLEQNCLSDEIRGILHCKIGLIQKEKNPIDLLLNICKKL